MNQMLVEFKMSKSNQTQLQKQNPDAPWLWNSDWNDGVVRTNAKTSMIGGIVMATLWNAIAWPLVLLLVPNELKGENYLPLLALIFPLAGIGLAVIAFRSIRRYMKFGESTFKMATTPGVVGGELVGVILTSAKIQADEGFRLTLNCVHRQVSGSGKNRRVSEKTLWQSMQRINRPLDPNSMDETAIPVQFAIPFECDPCSPDQSSTDRTYWKLEIAADQPGVDFHSTFEVPVFKTEASDPNFQPDTSLVEDFIHQPTVDEVYGEARLNRQSAGDQLKIEFPFLRNAKGAASATLFLAIWIGFTALMGYAIGGLGSLSFEGIVGLSFVGVFGLFGLLILYMAFDLWMWRGQITADRNGLEANNGRLSMKPRMIAVDQVKKINFKRTMQTGNLVFFDLILETTTNETITIGKRICNEAACRAIVQDIEQHLSREILSSQTAEPEESNSPQTATGKVFPTLSTTTGFDSFQSN